MDEIKRKQYEEKLQRLEEILSATEDGEKPEYVTSCLYQVYKILIENEQYADVNPTEPIFGKKLVRCYRYIPNIVLDLKEVERIVIGGLYLVVDTCIVPMSALREATNGNPIYGMIKDPEKYGLPSFSEVDYATRKPINEHAAIVLTKDSGINSEIWTASQYSYVTLN